MNKYFVFAVVLLAGTIIGAGIFSLPFLFNQLGIVLGFIYLFLFAGFFSLIYMMYARVVTTHEEPHRLIHLSRDFLPKVASSTIPYLILFELILALAIYLILASVFSGLVFGIENSAAVILFWAVSSFFIFAKLTWLGWAETVGVLSILIIVGMVFFMPYNSGLISEPSKLTILPENINILLLPFGPLIFAFAGRAVIAKVVDVWREAKSKKREFSLNKAIFWGTVTPAFVYVFFVIGILRMAPEISPEALNSLTFLPTTVVILIGALGLITLWTSYFTIGINVKEMINYDLKAPKLLTGAIVLFVPLIIYFLGLRDFIMALSIAGGLLLACEGIIIVAMWQKVSKKSISWRRVASLAYIFFAIAIVYTLYSFF